jgi:acetyl-CoA carboxylase biotin carboxylase subunit
MNTRIQVEHPVTEAITGIDLVAEQIAVAEGHPMGLRQEAIVFRGHAIECRINAEDSSRDFAPSPGTVEDVVFPVGRGIRVDSHIESGSLVPPFYDALLAKIIVRGANREEAIGRMRGALDACHIAGVATNLDFHRQIMRSEEFERGGVDTQLVERLLAADRQEVTAA